MNFYARAWNEDKTEPLALGSHCRACVRLAQRVRKGIAQNGVPFKSASLDGSRHYYQPRRSLRDKNRRRRVRYRDRMDPRLPVEPFRIWLQQKVIENSVAGVASNAGISSRRISGFLSGYYEKKLSGGSVARYRVKHVRLSVVDHICVSMGDHVNTIYSSEMIAKFRVASVDDDRYVTHDDRPDHSNTGKSR